MGGWFLVFGVIDGSFFEFSYFEGYFCGLCRVWVGEGIDVKWIGVYVIT